MRSESVQLAAIEQTFKNMQRAASLPVTQGDSFATTLFQASQDLTAPNTPFSTGEGLMVGDFANGVPTFATAALPTFGYQELTGTPSLALVNVNAVLSDAVNGSTGQAAVKTAMALEGTPYVWGGSQPGGFDCSGLVQYVYGQLGVKLPRTSENQATVGTPVGSLNSAKPGDLLFFAGSDGTASAPGHVGIYVGNGEMIDAPYTGTRVQLHSISTAGALVAIRRVVTGE